MVDLISAPDIWPEAFFRAVHQPIRFEQRGSEAAFLAAFLNDAPLAVILGSPGSGRSHFLRWLEIEFRSRNLDFLRIPAGQSANDLIQPSVGESISIRFEKEDVRNLLIAGLQREQQRAQERVAMAKQLGATPDPFDRDVAGWLAKGLGDLLDDPITAKQFSIDGQGTIAVLAEQLASGAATARFGESDFLRPDELRFLEAGRPAQVMLTKLNLSSTNQFRVAAANLLNRIVETGFETSNQKPTPKPIWLIEDSRSLDTAGIEDSLRFERAVIVSEDAEFSALLATNVWRIADLSSADAEAILTFAGAYLDAAQIDRFRPDELLAALVKDGEPALTPRTLLERLQLAVEENRAALSVTPIEEVAEVPPSPIPVEVVEPPALPVAEVEESFKPPVFDAVIPPSPIPVEVVEPPVPPVAEVEEPFKPPVFDAVFQRACDELDRAWFGVLPSIRQAALFRESGLIKPREMPRSAALEKYLAEVQQSMAESAPDLTESKPFRQFLRNLEKFGASLREKAAETWKTWLASWTPILDEEQIRRVEELSNQQEFIRTLREARDRAAELAEKVPTSPEQIAEAERVLREMKECLERLPTILEAAEVEAFRAAVDTGGAPLSLLTDAVVRWLRDGERTGTWRIVREGAGKPFEPS